MKLSVIVPVYNVEKFLPRCLDSLLRQGMEVGEWEVICVNDGSPDNCAAILAEYEKKYPDIFKVIMCSSFFFPCFFRQAQHGRHFRYVAFQ